MKKEEKTRISKERILQAAIQEFGTHSFEEGSMNSICERNGLSKGLIYHNFKNKDDLYLKALKRCIDDMNEFIIKGSYSEEDIKERVIGIFTRREVFFCENPYYKKLFFCALYDVPEYLEYDVKELMKSYYRTLCSLLSGFSFRNGASAEFVLEYMSLSSGMIFTYTKDKLKGEKDVLKIASEHEKNLKLFADNILFGIAERD